MKKINSIICFLLMLSITTARPVLMYREDPVHWSYSVKKLDVKDYEVHITAKVDAGWHIYSQVQPKEAVAVPTKIVCKSNPLIIIAGKPKEIGKKEKWENKEVGIIQYQYSDTVDFVQLINVKGNIKTNVIGSVSYQACTDEMCLPVKTVSFTLQLN